MRHFVAIIDWDNTAFDDQPTHELCRILHGVVHALADHERAGRDLADFTMRLRDANGITVGTAHVGGKS